MSYKALKTMLNYCKISILLRKIKYNNIYIKLFITIKEYLLFLLQNTTENSFLFYLLKTDINIIT